MRKKRVIQIEKKCWNIKMSQFIEHAAANFKMPKKYYIWLFIVVTRLLYYSILHYSVVATLFVWQHSMSESMISFVCRNIESPVLLRRAQITEKFWLNLKLNLSSGMLCKCIRTINWTKSIHFSILLWFYELQER